MDIISPKRRSEIMSHIKSKNMTPEMKVRRLAHSLGFRFRLHQKNLPGTPDLVFSRLNKIIFVHGCFWHQHGAVNCKIKRLPKSRQEYWIPKLERNKARDKKAISSLRKAGWEVLVIWECQTLNIKQLEKKLIRFLNKDNNKGTH